MKTRRFRIPPVWRTFRQARNSWRISVYGRPNCRNKAAFSNLSCVVWILQRILYIYSFLFVFCFLFSLCHHCTSMFRSLSRSNCKKANYLRGHFSHFPQNQDRELRQNRLTIESCLFSCTDFLFSSTLHCTFSLGCLGWTLVFKAVTGVNSIPADLWSASFSTNEDEQRALHPSNNFKQNYKNRIVLKWHSFAPSEVSFRKMFLFLILLGEFSKLTLCRWEQ